MSVAAGASVTALSVSAASAQTPANISRFQFTGPRGASDVAVQAQGGGAFRVMIQRAGQRRGFAVASNEARLGQVVEALRTHPGGIEAGGRIFDFRLLGDEVWLIGDEVGLIGDEYDYTGQRLGLIGDEVWIRERGQVRAPAITGSVISIASSTRAAAVATVAAAVFTAASTQIQPGTSPAILVKVDAGGVVAELTASPLSD